ncbi:DUF2852 domain-containing protein [uncultured Alsobacter sp.]|uniref:DUF2852 domain-containing protein n=1 Tax=uncultured Alsobacter sp. TaxID=1748258 RepID=UPI0025E648A9|nr:DUF2852 domain-containing protein [uncultured Alsobacter sp.]
MTPNYPPPPNGAASGWRWKPVDIAVLAIAFIVWWPAGLAVLAWKIWNDRQPVPTDLGDVLQTTLARLQAGFDSLVGSFGQPAAPSRGGPPQPTGNAAFDAHVRAEWARMEAERRALDEEIEAFRRHLATERSDDREVYERFKAGRTGGV